MAVEGSARGRNLAFHVALMADIKVGIYEIKTAILCTITKDPE